ncbi:AmmeMemoRadiSam system protein B [Chlorobaculum sp. MV4-Y]|uniref:AmmeMemoRadiSam system protein B n=1 Tax=Chlorobaculum sp. MV4-Y TaxID=2976335 RepID=UPI0021AF7A82|nr:AmmeMemoRadiSam system protein B [Chlorobaculum sp. MV4-Y]UWX58262.1 AmmeMemoRadiSam system protein B [Chlorobaculum sp. MV4-Y]
MRTVVSICLFFGMILASSSLFARTDSESSIRALADTVGFAHRAWQMDSVMARINALNHDDLARTQQPAGTAWRALICPHDDYSYTGWLYPAVLRNIKAKTVIIFGVAHTAWRYHLENQLIFDSFSSWRGPYGALKVSPLREEILKRLPRDMAVVHDPMQSEEYSAEAMIPFLQYQNRDVEIISILVPFMDFAKMQTISQHLSKALFAVMKKHDLRWGKDVAILISSDAVHYGDEDWGGHNFAYYGTGSKANELAEAHDREIINTCFESKLTNKKITQFYSYTTDPDDFKKSRWSWCGRYAIPVGLLTALDLQRLEKSAPLTGVPIAYATSISQQHLKIDDLRMGETAIASPRHWVGYAAVGFK